MERAKRWPISSHFCILLIYIYIYIHIYTHKHTSLSLYIYTYLYTHMYMATPQEFEQMLELGRRCSGQRILLSLLLSLFAFLLLLLLLFLYPCHTHADTCRSGERRPTQIPHSRSARSMPFLRLDVGIPGLPLYAPLCARFRWGELFPLMARHTLCGAAALIGDLRETITAAEATRRRRPPR